MSQNAAPPIHVPASLAHLLPARDADRAEPGQTILVRGERDAYARSFLPTPYRPPLLRERYPFITTMQAEARERILLRQSTILCAPTSSGKTLAFAAPIFESGRNAVFVYPYRALLYDQASELLGIAHAFGYSQADFGYVFGGVGKEEVASQLLGKKFLLTTPDKMVSLFMAGRANRLAALTFLSASDFVFDEIHAYSPMMIRSVIYFLRSVERFHEALARPGEKPVYIFSSATIPADLEAELSGSLGLGPSARLSGISNTGDVGLEIMPRKGYSSKEGTHLVAKDMVERGATRDAVAIMESPFAAYQITKSPTLTRSALLFVGQDKQSEKSRRTNLRAFTEERERHVFVGSAAIEAGVDLTFSSLFMETGYADSTVQRFGRAGRSGNDASIVMYGNLLAAWQAAGMIRMNYERSEMNDLLAGVHEPRLQGRLFSGLAASPYLAFWGEDEARSLIEDDDRRFIAELSGQGVPALLAFRNLAPYTSYDSGERIGYSSLFRKLLAMSGGKVSGSPSVDRYFHAPERPSVTGDVRQIAWRESHEVLREGRPCRVHTLLADIDFGQEFGRHWTVVEIGPGGDAPPDNMILHYRGRALNGPGTPNFVRFYS